MATAREPITSIPRSTAAPVPGGHVNLPRPQRCLVNGGWPTRRASAPAQLPRPHRPHPLVPSLSLVSEVLFDTHESPDDRVAQMRGLAGSGRGVTHVGERQRTPGPTTDVFGGPRDEPVRPVPGPFLEDVAGIGGAAVDKRRPIDRRGGVEAFGFGVVFRPLLHGGFVVCTPCRPYLSD